MFRHIYVIATKKEGKVDEKQSEYTFETEEEAIIDLYNLHGVALKNENLQATFGIVVNEIGEEVEKLAASIPDPDNKRQRYEIKPRLYWLIKKGDAEEFKIYKYATKQLARGNMFTKYAACRADKDCTAATLACINGDGATIELKVWDREKGEKPDKGTPISEIKNLQEETPQEPQTEEAGE